MGETAGKDRKGGSFRGRAEIDPPVPHFPAVSCHSVTVDAQNGLERGFCGFGGSTQIIASVTVSALDGSKCHRSFLSVFANF
jgi:hypothetical protein